MWKRIEPYKGSLILLAALIVGGAVGIYFPEQALMAKPIGQIFLNLLFMIIVPLVGVSVMSSIAEMTDLKKLGRILAAIVVISITMATIASLWIIGFASVFDPAQGVTMAVDKGFNAEPGSMDFVKMLTTNDFSGLLSKSNILALIIMSVMGGVAIGQSGEDGKAIALLLKRLNTVIMKVVSIIMTMAPVGLGAYFASTMASQDPELLGTFARAIGLFFTAAALYFVLGSIVYSWIGGGTKAIKAFWANALAPSATALGTCSSLATLPVNVRAARNMGMKEELVDICMPLLANLNKGGVAMIAALKIVFIYSVLGLEFTSEVFFLTVLISVLSAIIVGGVPGGAFLGEIFIVTSLGLPMEVIPMLVVIGAITDAPATLINAIHDLNATQIINRLFGRDGKNSGKTAAAPIGGAAQIQAS